MTTRHLAATLLLLASLPLHALETEWLEIKKGAEDKDSGAAIREIIREEGASHTTVIMAIPKAGVTNPELEEVVVYGKAPKAGEGESRQRITYEWVDDYEQDYYGLVIRFGNSPLWPVRLYLKSIETNTINP